MWQQVICWRSMIWMIAVNFVIYQYIVCSVKIYGVPIKSLEHNQSSRRKRKITSRYERQL